MHGAKSLANVEAWIALVEVQLALQPELDWLSHRVPGGHLYDPGMASFSRRLHVRSTFAYIEAMTYLLKRAAVGLAPGLLSDRATGNLVDEETFYLKDNGEVREGVSKLRLAPNILFSLKLFAQAVGAPYKHDGKAEGWQDLLDAIDVRDDLTHPKSAVDLDVTDASYAKVNRGVDWYSAQVVALLAVAGRAAHAIKAGAMTIPDEPRTPEYQEKVSKLLKLNEKVVALSKAPPPTRAQVFMSKIRQTLSRPRPSPGASVTITLDAELAGLLDAERAKIREATGIEPTRPAVAAKILTNALVAPPPPKKGKR